MSTPSRSNAAATPKTALTGTPSRVQSSPRAGVTSAPTRLPAGKSPAAKTPASHTYNVSTSSVPSSAPLAATTMPDDAMPFSPHSSALMATLAGQPLTPLPGAQDGLGISSIANAISGLHAAPVQDLATIRRTRLQEMVSLLKPRMAGRGVTREGIERLATSSGFDLLPDDHKLGVLGHHCVELELTFDPKQEDVVQQAELKLNLAGSEADSEIQEGASQLLRASLDQDSTRDGPWNNLDGFRANLEYLGSMDRLSSDVNCFAAVKSLYETFRSIWDAEKQRLTWRNSLQHLCRSNIGRPGLDSAGKLGLSVEYWTQNSELDQDDVPQSSYREKRTPNLNYWSAHISCESGLPSISKSFDWISDEVLRTSDEFAASALNAEDLQPLWRQITSDEDTTADSIDKLLDAPGVRFACHLDPPVFLPLNTPLLLDAQTIEVNNDKMMAYQQVVDKSRTVDSSASTAVSSNVPRSLKQINTYDKSGTQKTSRHSYALYPAQPFWCYRLDKFYFNHPRQMSDKIPVLRQHAILWTLLSKPFEGSNADAVSVQGLHAQIAAPETHGAKSGVKVRSNRALKCNQAPIKSKSNTSKTQGKLTPGSQLRNIDITIDPTPLPTESPQVRLNILVPLSQSRGPNYLNLVVDVQLNGALIVTSSTMGLNTDEISKKLTRVLEISEDLGVLVEWALVTLGADD